jgi:flagellar motor switch protein FliM
MTSADMKPPVFDDTQVPSGYIATDPKWPALQHARVSLVVKIPLPAMTLRDLAALKSGDIVHSLWPASEEVPLFASGVTLSWCEFAVMGDTIAARLTRLG